MNETGPPPPIQPSGMFDDIRPSAVLLGVLVDTAATVLGSLVLLTTFMSRDGREPSDEVLEELSAMPEFLLASLIVGLMCTVLGGYVGARRANRAHVRHGAWVAVGSALFGLAQFAVAAPQAPTPPLWFDLVGFSLMIPAGAAGGLLARVASRPATRGPA
jgi:hypothetical protein